MACLWKRGKTYYARYYVGGKQKAVCLETGSYPIAKEKLRQIESKTAMGLELPLPTKTPVKEVVAAYVAHIRNALTPNSVKVETYYLRDMFGPICPELQASRGKNNRKHKASQIQADFLEQIKTSDLVAFLTSRVHSRGLSPKTANHYRGTLSRLFSWAISQYGVHMPNNMNPGLAMERYREKMHPIRFLTLPQVDEQLRVLEDYPAIRVLVAVYIFAGLRREEALWLTRKDINFKAGKYGVIYVQAKDVGGEFWQPKTKVNRMVPISKTLREHFDRHEQRIVPHDWYFPSPLGKRWDPDNFSQALREINRAAGLPWSCLDFRHTFGSLLAMKGESLYKIATLMGNSPEICRRHYAALLPESLIDSVEFTEETSALKTAARAKPNLYLFPKQEAAEERKP